MEVDPTEQKTQEKRGGSYSIKDEGEGVKQGCQNEETYWFKVDRTFRVKFTTEKVLRREPKKGKKGLFFCYEETLENKKVVS